MFIHRLPLLNCFALLLAVTSTRLFCRRRHSRHYRRHRCRLRIIAACGVKNAFGE
jgi:hypothetical protein